MTREFDIIVYGASGFTGRLVAEYLDSNYQNGGPIKWAMAGRNLEKLAAVRNEIGAPNDTPLIACDANDPASLDAMVKATKVVLTTVGPYQLYGEGLVAACAAHGTDYVDLCGEPVWMRFMIDAYEAAAKASGSRIVFSCGFDSIPFDLGVQLAQEEMMSRFGVVAGRINARVRKISGGASGGTVASLKATLAAAADPVVLAHLMNHYSITPGFTGPKQPSGMKIYEDTVLGQWVAPFVMAPINTRNVHRTNFLLGHPYGKDFLYEEMMATGPGERGLAMANAVAGDKSMSSDNAPKLGEGPSKAEREAGHYDILFMADGGNGKSLKVAVSGDRDPGYGSTSKMISEAAVCLLDETRDDKGGIWTAGALLGPALRARLTANAGLTFAVED